MENKNDVELGYDIAKEIITVMLDSEGKEVSVDAFPNMKEWIGKSEKSELIIQKFTSPEMLSSMCEQYNSNEQYKQSERLATALLNKIQRQKRYRTLRSGVSVAAAIIAVSMLVYTMTDTPKLVTNDPIARYKEIIPAKKISSITKPTIILEDGSSIEIKNGENLHINGSKIAESDHNQLSYKSTIDSRPVMNTIVIPHEQRYCIILADGTEVILGANSKLKYPTAFTSETREVELEGEAFFNVTKSDKQFVVKVSGVDVKVYGTKFNINAYGSNVKTALLSGSIGVGYTKNNAKYETRIAPNECFSYDTQSEHHQLETGINREKYLSWLDGYFRCDGDKVSDLLNDLSNWYGVTFKYELNDLNKIRINALLNSNLKIDDLLKMIELSVNIQFKKEKGGCYIVE